MDGFDDLLAPSRSALEDNPFADPFAKRSGSPDPWASPFAGIGSSSAATADPSHNPFSSPSHAHDDVFSSSNHFYQSQSASDVTTSPTTSREHDREHDAQSPTTPTRAGAGVVTAGETETMSIKAALASDPLDSANVTKDDDGQSSSVGLRSPGFRESLPSPTTTFSAVGHGHDDPHHHPSSSSGPSQQQEPFVPEPPTTILKSEQEQLLKQRQSQSLSSSSSPTRVGSPAPTTQTTGTHSSGSGVGASSRSGFDDSSPLVNTLERDVVGSPLGGASAGAGGSTSSVHFGLERSLAGLSLTGAGDAPLGGGLHGVGVGSGGWGSEQDAWGGGFGAGTVGASVSTPSLAEKTPTLPAASGSGAITVEEDDSDDDKPIGQIRKASQDDSKGKVSSEKKDNNLQPVFVITVDDPQKVGDPIRPYTMYTVHTRTTSPMFQKSAFSVLRRYSDFLWLYETLWMNNPGVVVPPVPEKSSFGRFDDQFVKQRRTALQKCIQKIANHPVLMKDVDLKFFLESDTFALDVKHRKAEMAHERGGLMASLGQTIAGPRFHETDEWFDRQKGYLDSLESQLRGLVKAIEAVSKQRNELATATGDFANTISELSESDVGKQLSHSLSGLASVQKKAQELQVTQADQDLATLMATVEEYARLINSVRMAFSSRIRTYHTWKNSESDLLKTKQNHERNKAQGKVPTDRLSYSLAQIAEAERRTLEAKHEYEHVTKLVKSEMARFEQERIEDFKDSLHAFLEGMISRQKELITTWENYQHMLLTKVGKAPGQAGGNAGNADDESARPSSRRTSLDQEA
ncbi:hypothetical protein AX16_001785 [Volvariella volvacea WC 439]|nr:hypothetical protein AX16_001785 [Volvariella volvacea WC 439]